MEMILLRLTWGSTYCTSCRGRVYYDKFNQKRKNRYGSTKRRRPVHCMPPKELEIEFDKVQSYKRNINKRFDRMMCRLQNFKNHLSFQDETLPKKQLERALAYARDNWDDCKTYIIEELFKLSDTDIAQTPNIEDEKKNFVAMVLEQFDNMAKDLKQTSNGKRYSHEMINLAITVYSRSKKGYNDLKESMAINLPAGRTLEMYLKPLRFKDGPQPKSYAMLNELNKSNSDQIYGHLMMDEIKLKNGIMWNCKNNEVTGYIPDELDCKDMMKTLMGLKDSNEHSGKQIKAYANQWRFRSTRGLVHNASYFLNKGILDGNEIAAQFMHVLAMYETIGIYICGIVCDGGGSNESFIEKLASRSGMKYIAVSEDTVRILHPFDKKRWIYIWSCGTHSLKALRNNIFRSQLNKTRNLKLSDVAFGWNEILIIADREDKRYKEGKLQQSDVRAVTVRLDSFTTMNATYAKQPLLRKQFQK